MADDKLLDKFIGDWNNADKTASRLKQIYIDSPGGQTAIYYIIQDTVSYTHLTLPTTLHECRSRWSPYH